MSAQPGRRPELDALRGLLLLIMIAVHLQTEWSAPFVQPLGFVSAAEGFIFLSAFLIGARYLKREPEIGHAAAARSIYQRTWRLYLYHLATVAFAFTVVAGLGLLLDRPAAVNMLGFFLDAPLWAAAQAMALIYRPPLLDILPLYVSFMALTPWLLRTARRSGWKPVLLISTLLWISAQAGLWKGVYAVLGAMAGMDVPQGAFDLLAWQLLWVIGLYLADLRTEPELWRRLTQPRWVGLASALAVFFLVWRHRPELVGLASADWLMPLLGKWQMRPLRLLNFLSLVLILIGIGTRVRNLPRIYPLERLGKNSLQIFSIHLIVVMLILGLVPNPPYTGATGWLVMALGFGGVFAATRLLQRRQSGAIAAAHLGRPIQHAHRIGAAKWGGLPLPGSRSR